MLKDEINGIEILWDVINLKQQNGDPVFVSMFPTGSVEIGSDRPFGDFDVVILAARKKDTVYGSSRQAVAIDTTTVLEKLGFKRNENEEYSFDGGQGLMEVYRFKDINLIVCNHQEYYIRWYYATAIAKSLGLKKKVDRISLFESIVDTMKDSEPIDIQTRDVLRFMGVPVKECPTI